MSDIEDHGPRSPMGSSYSPRSSPDRSAAGATPPPRPPISSAPTQATLRDNNSYAWASSQIVDNLDGFYQHATLDMDGNYQQNKSNNGRAQNNANIILNY